MKTIAGLKVPDEMGPTAHILPDGMRLHLQHGPIDLIIGADKERQKAFEAAVGCFNSILDGLVGELPALRARLTKETPAPTGAVAKVMHDACLPFCETTFVTPMAAVAGSVASTVLQAMVKSAELDRAYVNNGGDIALYLSPGARFTTAMQGHDGTDLGRITISAEDNVRGIATSGRHGRSQSLGIADSVTVLGATAAQADVAATLIANAVDLPNHRAVQRRPACEISPESDLKARQVVVGCAELSKTDRQTALLAGLSRAQTMLASGQIRAACMVLQGETMTTQTHMLATHIPELSHA